MEPKGAAPVVFDSFSSPAAAATSFLCIESYIPSAPGPDGRYTVFVPRNKAVDYIMTGGG